MKTELNNSADIIDSRDVIARIEELQELADAVSTAMATLAELRGDNASPEAIDAAEDEAAQSAADFDEDAQEELATLSALAEEAAGYAADWSHGETLIRDSYFTEYCQELLEDIGDLPKDLPHYIVIDWEATARNIRMDYTAVEFGDVTYWIR
jgi:antirestriction protein